MLSGINVLGPTQTHFIPSREARVKMSSEKGSKYIHAQERKLYYYYYYLTHFAPNFKAATSVRFEGDEPKSLAEVAHSYAETPAPSSPTHEKPHRSLAEAAMEYQEHMSPPQAQPARVTVVTGEEEERNVLQVNCFVPSDSKITWRGCC